MCEHCFNSADFTLPFGVSVCGQCFHESYCRLCWQHTNVVGERILHNDMMLCLACANNTPLLQPIEYESIDDIIHINYAPINNYAPIIYDEEEEEPWAIAPIEDIYDEIPNNHDPLLAPPAGFDMNAASLVEENPDYMDNLINAQIEHEGEWYFALDGQIYSVPYEIEIDDDYVRQDIRDNWDGVEWRGSIFGNYIAWH